ncbi:MAG: hypothetical protein RLZZ469_1650 [Bacteroidota bacterium]|jgi:hypothetical protein
MTNYCKDCEHCVPKILDVKERHFIIFTKRYVKVDYENALCAHEEMKNLVTGEIDKKCRMVRAGQLLNDCRWFEKDSRIGRIIF